MVSNGVNDRVNDSVLNALTLARSGEELSPEMGLELLLTQDSHAIEQIRDTADFLRSQQSGETVTYVINRNINYTNICEQHCSFCAFRRDEGDVGAYWLDFETILYICLFLF